MALLASAAAAAATATAEVSGSSSSSNSSSNLRSFLEVLQEQGMENLVKRLDPDGAHSPEPLRYVVEARRTGWVCLLSCGDLLDISRVQVNLVWFRLCFYTYLVLL